ncbi:dehydrodolichyl diphosphate synthase complex subunit DHDDS-like [Lytechinus variegatus]|uniref:dehydrodolichyl diphosphate synthase complex subunit DHDDS-like n=1 Tax=Lytechinus variegatus TaxID=7654 RepID=UPI001BB0F95A|nr:dehydrodolichyl diphosphate synthase complex subunit DHDDS-like [Lytechinus variegatus]
MDPEFRKSNEHWIEASAATSEWFPEKQYQAQKTWFQSFCLRVLKCGPVPQHVAFIMDGNRRFAKKKSFQTLEGHSLGFEKLAETLQWCLDLGITEVTVYAFSIENFKRSRQEVDGLMELARKKFLRLLEEKDQIMKHGVCVRVIGDLDLLPRDVQEVVAEAMFISRDNTRATLNVCLAYTSRQEMANAVKEVALGVEEGILFPSDVSEELIEQCLYTNRCKDPELLVRTSGEVRLSDFLLWQSGYSVLSFVEVLWPEFSIWHLFAAVLHYQTKYNAVQTAKEAMLHNRRRAVQESDHRCVLDQLNNSNQTTISDHIETPSNEDSFHKRLSEYTRDRESRIAKFLGSLHARRENFLISLLPERTRCQLVS